MSSTSPYPPPCSTTICPTGQPTPPPFSSIAPAVHTVAPSPTPTGHHASIVLAMTGNPWLVALLVLGVLLVLAGVTFAATAHRRH